MNLLNCKKNLGNRAYLFILIALVFSSCIEEKDYRKKENLDLLMNKTIKYTNNFNKKKYKKDDSLEGVSFKVNKLREDKKDSKLYYDISIPYNLRGDELELFLERFSKRYLKKRASMYVEVKHIGTEKISGVVASYSVKLKDKSFKLTIDFIDYLSEEKLKKKGIEHHILEYDYSVVANIVKEMNTNKHLSMKSASIKVAKQQKLSVKKVNEILKFAKKYYSKK